MSTITVINPATGSPSGSCETHSPAAVEAALKTAANAFEAWRARPLRERTEPLRRLSGLMKVEREALAHLMAREMGKPVTQGRAEADKCAWVCGYYAEQAAVFLAPETVVSDADESFVTFQPLGAVLAIMPWNFPFWQVFRFAAPALTAGNVGVIKHALNVPGCAAAMEELFARAGYPEGVFTSVLLENGDAEALIDDPRIAAVTLTGSTRAGRAVASRAGAALKKTVLELGGSDPYVVLDDADAVRAADLCVKSRLINGGQSCIAAKRFIVTAANRDAFERRVTERMAEARTGDPMEDDVDIGPLARADLRDQLHRQVTDSVARGARLLLGGNIPSSPGFYYPPTVLTDVRPGMPAFDDELFGPVAAIVPAADERDALTLANQSVYGLGAAVFTRNIERGRDLAAHHLQAGCCFVNDFVKSDPRLPFGGIRQSGYGRELALHGIREFVNIKTVCVNR